MLGFRRRRPLRWSVAIGLFLAATATAHSQSAPATDRLVLQQIPTALNSATEAIYPTSQGPLFAQLATGAVMRSDDSAQTWRIEPLPPRANAAELRLVTVDRTGAAVAFARVPRAIRPNPNPYAVERQVVLYTFLRARSGDTAWTTIQPPADPAAEVQAASPANPDVLYATTDAAQRDDYVFYIWRSRDGGGTWDRVNEQRVYGTCSILLQPHPSDPLRVFSPGLKCYGGLGGGAPSPPRFKESRDQAVTWTDLVTVDRLRNLPFRKDSLYGKVSLVLGGMPPSPTVLLAEIDYDPRLPGQGVALFRSLDDGQTWNSLLELTPWDLNLHPEVLRSTSLTLGRPTLDPRTPDTLVLTDGRLSDDGGQTWTGSPALDTDVHPVMTSAGLLAATSSGVMRLQLVHQPVQLPERWRVLGTDFDHPSAISVAPDGSILVGDGGRVRRLSADGLVLQDLRGIASAPIDGLVQDAGGAVYLAERSPHLEVIAPDASVSTLLDGAGTYIGGVALDGAGNVYATQPAEVIPLDNPAQAVIVASTDGGAVQADWGSYGHDPGQFGGLNWGVCLDGNGNVYVADTTNNRVQEFGPDGALLTTFDGLHGPTGIALDASGNLYVADTDANRVLELAPDGTQLASWGTWGAALGQLWQPLGVAVDPSSGSVYIADTFNNRVVRIDRPA